MFTTVRKLFHRGPGKSSPRPQTQFIGDPDYFQCHIAIYIHPSKVIRSLQVLRKIPLRIPEEQGRKEILQVYGKTVRLTTVRGVNVYGTGGRVEHVTISTAKIPTHLQLTAFH